MTGQLRLRFKSEQTKGAGLPHLDAEQRATIRALPPEIVRGIASLFRQPAPQITKPDVWPVIVADVLYLATTGWAADSFALGWQSLEVFGCAVESDGDDARLGLAGRLDGRDIVRLTNKAALLRAGAEAVILHRNQSVENTTFLWEYGQ